jgi:hypothetical protein
VDFNPDPALNKGAGIWEGIGVTEPGLMIECIWHLVPETAIPWQAIAFCMGRVNGWEFKGFAEGTLLCEAPKMVPKVAPSGELIYNIHYFFRYLPKVYDGVARGHNWFLRAVKRSEGIIDLVYRLLTLGGGTSGRRIYLPADFADLFRPDSTFVLPP